MARASPLMPFTTSDFTSARERLHPQRLSLLRQLTARVFALRSDLPATTGTVQAA